MSDNALHNCTRRLVLRLRAETEHRGTPVGSDGLGLGNPELDLGGRAFQIRS